MGSSISASREKNRIHGLRINSLARYAKVCMQLTTGFIDHRAQVLQQTGLYAVKMPLKRIEMSGCAQNHQSTAADTEAECRKCHQLPPSSGEIEESGKLSLSGWKLCNELHFMIPSFIPYQHNRTLASIIHVHLHIYMYSIRDMHVKKLA